jgi:glycyl-tRNA synthetase
VRREGTLSDPRMFNLMFKTFMGRGGQRGGGLPAPGDGQGIYVNFPQRPAVDAPEGPFGIAQIGKAFRNEITPGQLHLPHA